jgi:hypothetical protein
MKKIVIFSTALIATLIAVFAVGKNGCGEGEKASPSEEESPVAEIVGPAFCADSAYEYVAKQCEFGPRVMNSAAHDKCEEWIIAKFKQFGCGIKTQKVDLKGYDGTILHSTNIMASVRPELKKRVLICAHWDSRPWADNDPDSTNWRKPVMAANDGASGVAVMLEIARLLQNDKTLNVGVDFVCFDAEDWGTPQWSGVQDDGTSWALGAQYFSANLPQGYDAEYGILLDMVGGQGAKFYQEGMSKQFAPDVLRRVWRAAAHAGYGSFFPKKEGGMITDDHIPVNKVARIPTVDIIPYYPDCEQSSFGPTWHTVSDDLAHIDVNTLKAVGQTVIQTIFEK